MLSRAFSVFFVLMSLSSLADTTDGDKQLLNECFAKMTAVEWVFANETETLDQAMQFSDRSPVIFSQSVKVCNQYLSLLKEVKGE